MSAAASSGAEKDLELGHVLFVDIVAYSKRLINEQTALVARLNELVLQTEQCRKADAAGKLIRIPTGDGMGLAEFLQTSFSSLWVAPPPTYPDPG